MRKTRYGAATSNLPLRGHILRRVPTSPGHGSRNRIANLLGVSTTYGRFRGVMLVARVPTSPRSRLDFVARVPTSVFRVFCFNLLSSQYFPLGPVISHF